MNTKRLYIIVLALWVVAQFAVIDHLYGEAHSEDNICEWCLNNNKTPDPAVSTSIKVINPEIGFKRVVYIDVVLNISKASFLIPPNRAPPVA